MNELFPRTSLEQWRVLMAIVEYGGYAQAAEVLHRSQSSVSYAVARLQESLGVTLLEPEGRRMKLTAVGDALLRDARPLIDAALRLEGRARALDQGWEPEVTLAVDALFPTRLLLKTLSEFAGTCTQTRVQVHEVVMSGADEALYAGKVELAVVRRVPQGFIGDWLMDVELVAVAAPGHPLFQLERELSLSDLVMHNQVVLRDSGERHPRNDGWLGAERRWTFGNPQTMIEVVEAGLGFAWLPIDRAAEGLAKGRLVQLPLKCGQSRKGDLSLVYADPEHTGPAVKALANCLRSVVAAE
ncbi:LysR family transcriptional regulator [Crenobacter sp. SG2303]|uniref:LysR family transcriptional regulator n=1 Tax=Crenobacter oryzisoli TaxID=3056844 RepID=A0ABT7XJ54_9NEIS|nr:LysR family transcriptional regulator [Crenobacter sp. SG2303]MDN0073798.1 LysR family transcriptional regulator [Crenobacter sp. SG2303]